MRNLKLAIRHNKRVARHDAALYKNRFAFNVCLAAAFLLIAALFALPTFGATLFAAIPVAGLAAKSVITGKIFAGKFLLGMAAPVGVGNPTRGQFRRNPNANYGIQREPVPGIALSSSLMSVTHDSDRRYHEFDWQCSAVNYTGGAEKAITKVTGSGVGGTATITVSAYQVPLTAAVNTGGSGYVTADIVSVADATGAGAQWTVTASAGAITALTLVPNTASATAIDPRLIISNIQLIVGTTAVVETTAAMEIFRALFNFQPISYGHFPIYFTEPWRNLTDARATSWDMAGQGTFTTKFTMVPGYQSVGITGTMYFDYIRNTVAGEIDQVSFQNFITSGAYPLPKLKIIARKLLTPTLNGNDTIIQPQLIPTGWPILRMHFFPANAGTINKILMKADTQIIEQGLIGNQGALLDQMREGLIERGFNTAVSAVAPSVNPDYSYVSDYDQRVQNQLKVASLNLTLTSSGGQQGLTILQEVLQSSYS